MLRKCAMLLCFSMFVLVIAACATPPTVPPTAVPPTATPPPVAQPTSAPAATAAPTTAAAATKAPAPTQAPASGNLDKVTAAWVAITGNQAPAWLAKEGSIYQKYGLDVNLSFIQGSSTATASMIGGSTDIVQMAGAAAVTAANQGGDVVLIAGFINVSVFKLMADPSVKGMNDLKGKTIAITKFGSSDEFVLRKILKDNGLEAGKDVKISTSGDASGQLAALKAKLADAILLSPPNDVTARKQGAVEIFDSTPLKIPYQAIGLATTRKYIAAHRATAIKFIQAEVDAIRRFKSDRNFAKQVMAKYLQTNDDDVLEASWQVYSAAFADIPYPSEPGIQQILDESGIKDKKPADFVDASLLKELEASGFFATK